MASRASRSSRTGAPISGARCSRTARCSPTRRRRSTARAGRSVTMTPVHSCRRVRLSVPRRPVRHRGQPDGGAAGPCARPLPVRDRRGPADPREAVQRGEVDGKGRTPRSTPTSSPVPGSTSTAGSRSSTQSSPRTNGRRKPHARSPRADSKLEAAINYPIDWLEERSGLVGGIKYFLFRKVPGDTNWFHTLGSATLTAFLVQALTGSILAMYYKPDPNRTPISRSSTSRTTSRSAGSSAACTSGARASSSS